MGFGLYGKLPAKRDFVARNLPRDVLAPLEGWINACLAESQSTLQKQWQELFLVAPIWHFWMGSEVLGTPCAGAMMPSVDRVGRYYPLLLAYVFDGEASMKVPMFNADERAWYAQLDEAMLGLLDADHDIDIEGFLAALPAPPLSGGESGGELYPIAVRDGALIATGLSTDCTETAAYFMSIDHADAQKKRVYWFRPLAGADKTNIIASQGLPHPSHYTQMLLNEPTDEEAQKAEQ